MFESSNSNELNKGDKNVKQLFLRWSYMDTKRYSCGSPYHGSLFNYTLFFLLFDANCEDTKWVECCFPFSSDFKGPRRKGNCFTVESLGRVSTKSIKFL